MSATPIVVSGFGRCGSSLVMQMLHAGGVPCLGQYPAFEGRAAVAPGQAVKILDPHREAPAPYPIPPLARVIWLDRDAREQAASHAKFVALTMGLHYDREHRRRLVAMLRADRPHALRAIGKRPLLLLSFEGLLASPGTQAARLAAFVGSPLFDVAAAVRQVQRRSPRCAEGLAMELGLMNRQTT